MIGALYALVSLIVVLGIMIIVHELGHFTAAKLFGVRVEAFSVGFGKPLIAIKYGETEYRLSPIPLGGYVKMAGETTQDEHTGDPGEFTSHPRWQRLVIAFAGPFMNMLLAVVLVTIIFTFHNATDYTLDKPAVVGYVEPGSAADMAGVKAGDTIVAAANHATPLWKDLNPLIEANTGRPVNLTYQRNGQTLNTTLTPKSFDNKGDAGWDSWRPLIVTDINLPDMPSDMPAKKAGVRVGDEILSINGVTFYHIIEINHYLQQNGAKPVQLTVRRGSQTLTFSITPASVDDSEGHKVFLLGFVSNVVKVGSLPVNQAFAQSLTVCRRGSVMIFDVVGKMIERKASIKQFSGPITIARMSGETVQHKGWYDNLWLIAIISLNLGVLNLFPIPILDGGMILFLLIEGAIRRDINMAIKERIYQVAFVCLILFAVVVIYNDIVKALPKHF